MTYSEEHLVNGMNQMSVSGDARSYVPPHRRDGPITYNGAVGGQAPTWTPNRPFNRGGANSYGRSNNNFGRGGYNNQNQGGFGGSQGGYGGNQGGFGSNQGGYGGNRGGYGNNRGGYSQGFQSRSNQYSNSAGYGNYQSNAAGVGRWDMESGKHVWAPRDERMEQQLYKSAHVSSGINFSKYDDIPVEASGTDVPGSISTFEEATLDPLLIENIQLAGYKTPTPVQKFSIPVVGAGRDLMACAQTGSGKTAGFLFPILNELFMKGPPADRTRERNVETPVALILSPTRELTSQIYDEAKRFAYRSWVRPVVVYGGVPMGEQTRQMRNGCDLLVATPGRLVDMMERGLISLRHVRYLILDEADRMLDMGFEPQIRSIVEKQDMPPVGQRITLMFSATFPREIQYLARDFLGDYIFLSVGRVGSASENVKQQIIEVSEHEKREVLLDILNASPASAENLTLIFVETKRMADILANFLYDSSFPATAIHGDRDQRERERALHSFRSARTPILVATAVAARGLDIPNVTHVINYDLPNDIDDYVHRIGRTGRAGNTGTATAFFTAEKNRNIVDDLMTILRDANQEIPDFLESNCKSTMGARGAGGRGRGRGRNNNTRDFRRDAEYKTYQPQQRDYSNGWGGNGYSGDAWGPPPSGSYGGGGYGW